MIHVATFLEVAAQALYIMTLIIWYHTTNAFLFAIEIRQMSRHPNHSTGLIIRQVVVIKSYT